MTAHNSTSWKHVHPINKATGSYRRQLFWICNTAGEHDRRVVAAARQARVSLKPRLPRVFDEVVDIVNFDLVLVLDHFDLTEVGLTLLFGAVCKRSLLPKF